ncbi:nuclear transport factor 2 family protein [Klenkia terrae]|uniref:Nuclear transport factor 2 family protein n=1 Tax=Klenkia terrae TaxID=1052259 RepID=A0ABU8E7J4_9ACTN|nr:nuclear transport factor 2 family protein [Klenkia terrae]
MSHTPTPDSMADLQRRIAVLEDREAIRELDARYCRYLDQGQWDELADCFTPDGTFDGLSVVRGRSDLVRFFAGLADGGLTTFWHHISNLEITVHPGADDAHTTSLLWQPCVVDGVPHVAAGRYQDTLTRTPSGWRYQVKQVRFSYFAPLNQGWDDHRFTLDSARAAALPRPNAFGRSGARTSDGAPTPPAEPTPTRNP